MTELETFLVGILMSATMDPNVVDSEDLFSFREWTAFWSLVAPAWRTAASAYGWPFTNSYAWST